MEGRVVEAGCPEFIFRTVLAETNVLTQCRKLVLNFSGADFFNIH